MRLLLIFALIPSFASAATCYSGISCLGSPIASGVTGQACLEQGARSYFSDTYQRCFESWEDHQQLDSFEWAPRGGGEPATKQEPPQAAVETVVQALEEPLADTADLCEGSPWLPECPGAKDYCDTHAWESPCVELAGFCLGHPWEAFCLEPKAAPLAFEAVPAPATEAAHQ